VVVHLPRVEDQREEGTIYRGGGGFDVQNPSSARPQLLRARVPYWILQIVDSPYNVTLDRRELLGPRATLVVSRNDRDISSACLQGSFCKINNIRTSLIAPLYMPLSHRLSKLYKLSPYSG
jgi:hypothetical protein